MMDKINIDVKQDGILANAIGTVRKSELTAMLQEKLDDVTSQFKGVKASKSDAEDLVYALNEVASDHMSYVNSLCGSMGIYADRFDNRARMERMVSTIMTKIHDDNFGVCYSDYGTPDSKKHAVIFIALRIAVLKAMGIDSKVTYGDAMEVAGIHVQHPDDNDDRLKREQHYENMDKWDAIFEEQNKAIQEYHKNKEVEGVKSDSITLV